MKDFIKRGLLIMGIISMLAGLLGCTGKAAPPQAANADPFEGFTAENLPAIRHAKLVYQGTAANSDIFTVTEKDGKPVGIIEDAAWKEGEQYVFPLAAEEYDKLRYLLKVCEVAKWDGFSGSAPNVLDGYSFSFSLEYADGKSVYARGTNKFPANFQRLKKGFGQIFTAPKKQYEYERKPKTLQSDALEAAFIHFVQKGKSGRNQFDFELRTDVKDRQNCRLTIKSLDGEFFGGTKTEKSYFGRIDDLDLAPLQQVVRKYDLPALNGCEKIAEDYQNCEWFKWYFHYASGETFGLSGSLPPVKYDEMRREIIETVLKIAEKHKNKLVEH